MFEFVEKFRAQIGELAQHNVIGDVDLSDVGERYFASISAVLNRSGALEGRKPVRYLEIAPYRHILGYELHTARGFESTHFDICDRDLELGRETALAAHHADSVALVCGDFHDLPFSDGYFDFVFVSASLHHTRTPDVIIAECMRVLNDGGYFHCQREPLARLFSFYQYTGNAQISHTPFEKAVAKRGMTRTFSSPFPGTRTAALFERIENDRIPLETFEGTFEKFGSIVEATYHFEGLLTPLDHKILAMDHTDPTESAKEIADMLRNEVAAVEGEIGQIDRRLGFSLPGDGDIVALSATVAQALADRPPESDTEAWRRSMAQIFGSSLAFLVQRHDASITPPLEKYRRSMTTKGLVEFDDQVYTTSGLRFWDTLLPPIESSEPDALQQSLFPRSSWTYFKNPSGSSAIMATSEQPTIHPELTEVSLAVMRYIVVLDDDLPECTLQVHYGDELVAEQYLPMQEPRMLRFVAERPGQVLTVSLLDAQGQIVSCQTRLRMHIFQCIPVHAERMDAEAAV